ncbi:MAG TPA: argininosuccinate synthase [Polyangia bacterium]|jgi:argininosuccinate synthase|nr:argininosuccinate synthase [Polyangia bacterium]
MKIVLAYSGGLDTSVAIGWLQEKYKAEIVAFCSDVGQQEDLEAARQKALGCGVVACHVLDQRDEFVRDFVFPAVRAAALYQGEYYLGTSLARPCITRGLMEVAAKEKTNVIAHGATGKGNDQVRFELGAYWFNPSVKIIAPWREWDFKSRSEMIAFAQSHNIPVEASTAKPYSIDRNLLHTSYEGGILEDPDAEPPAEIFQRTVDPRRAPDRAREVAISFERGTPVAVDGKTLSPAALLAELNKIAGEHGVGRADVVEDRFVGMKSRGVYETPGGTLLYKAHRGVASLTMDREAMRLRDTLAVEYATLVYRGFWFSPEREALQKLVDDVNEPVTGTARLRLYKGSLTLIGRTAPRSLYRTDIVTFEDDRGAYDQRDAGGFIRLNALRLRTTSSARKK